jgi:outer membrane protein assembly factor BamB
MAGFGDSGYTSGFMSPRPLITACVAALCVSAQGLSSEDPEWGRFRGPNGAGVSQARDLPDNLDPETNLAWRTEIPPGFSSPVHDGERVYLTACEGAQPVTICLDLGTGTVLWKRASPRELSALPRGQNSPTSPTPTTDGENVYVFFDSFGLLSYDSTGELRWEHPLGPFRTPYGMGTSPVVAGELVLLLCDQDGASFLLALDRDSGEQRWKTPRPGATHGFSTPILYTPADRPAEIIVSGSFRVGAYSLESGARTWWLDGMAWQAKSVPVLHNDRLFVHSWMASPSTLGVRDIKTLFDEALGEWDRDGDALLDEEEVEELGLSALWFLADLDQSGALDGEEWELLLARGTSRNGLHAVQLGRRGALDGADVLWRVRRSLPNIPSPLFYQGLLYILKEGGILTALDPLDGKVVRTARIEGAVDTYFASPVAADGKLFTASHGGRLAVIDPGANWSVVSVCNLAETIWATPALAEGLVIVRTERALYAFADAPE